MGTAMRALNGFASALHHKEVQWYCMDVLSAALALHGTAEKRNGMERQRSGNARRRRTWHRHCFDRLWRCNAEAERGMAMRREGIAWQRVEVHRRSMVKRGIAKARHRLERHCNGIGEVERGKDVHSRGMAKTCSGFAWKREGIA